LNIPIDLKKKLKINLLINMVLNIFGIAIIKEAMKGVYDRRKIE
jgi:hypothetical protein